MLPSGDRGGNAGPLPLAKPRLLARRLAAAVFGVRGDPAGDAWAKSVLTPAEYGLWTRLSPYDRSHAVDTARRTRRRLARTAYGGDTLWLGAALMHDVGKAQSNLSTLERVIATLASKTVGVATAREWAGAATGKRRRIGSYLIHGELGANMIRAAGGREEVAVWTEIHQGYRDIFASGIPPIVVEALLESDVG
jgi:hypothetical protein